MGVRKPWTTRKAEKHRAEEQSWVMQKARRRAKMRTKRKKRKREKKELKRQKGESKVEGEEQQKKVD